MIEFIKQKKNLLIIIGIIILTGIYWFFNMSETTKDIATQDNILEVVENKKEQDIENDDEVIVVHITGGVKEPGIVKLKENSRIEDAIEAAGGLTDDSDISDVNLAYLLDDGIKIRIPTINDSNDKDKEESYITEDSGKNIILEDNSESSSTSIVNINKATQTELETLPGIGPSLAIKIIEYREANGKFSKKEDIKNVTGIGDSKYANIEKFIVVK